MEQFRSLLDFDQIRFDRLAEGLLVLILGILAIRLILVPLFGLVVRRGSQQSRLVVKKGVWYGGLFFVFIGALSIMGVEVRGILGAAGIAGVAIGIASQSSLSNIIAGLFLVSENTFTLGDVIKVDTTVGVVYAVDLLAVKLRTFDNTVIRIPHQKLITSVVQNITKFPVRRMDFKLRVGFGTDLELCEELMRRVAAKHPLALNNPEPFVMFTEFSDSGVEILLGVWFEKNDFVAVKNGITRELVKAFAEAGLKISYPHVTLTEKTDV